MYGTTWLLGHMLTSPTVFEIIHKNCFHEDVYRQVA